MGQNHGSGVRGSLPTQVALLSDHLIKQAAELKQTATLSYVQLLESLEALNSMTQSFSECNGKKLLFSIKQGTDNSMWWRALVRIRCQKINSRTGVVESTRLFTLKQYIHLYNEISIIMSNQGPTNHQPDCQDESPNTDACGAGRSGMAGATKLDASAIFNRIVESETEGDSDEEECVICMDRKARIILPCSHSYCEECIEAWQDFHRSCPMCRASVGSREDSWVLSERPDDHEMAYETTGYLMGLVDRHPPDNDPD